MEISRWSPFGEIMPLRERINRLFDELTPEARRELSGQAHQMRGWTPAVDVEDLQNEIVITVELPGVKQEDIEIEMSGDVLTVKGERKFEQEEKGRNFVRIERAYGSFQRSFTIGVPIEAQNVTASYENGLLKLTLPKAEALKPRKVQISVNNQPNNQSNIEPNTQSTSGQKSKASA